MAAADVRAEASFLVGRGGDHGKRGGTEDPSGTQNAVDRRGESLTSNLVREMMAMAGCLRPARSGEKPTEVPHLRMAGGEVPVAALSLFPCDAWPCFPSQLRHSRSPRTEFWP
jgi:hypothetical protein